MGDEPACWSKITLEHGSPPDVVPYGPGDVTDADDEHLRVLRRTIVEPVVASLLTAEELSAEHLADGLEDWIAESGFGWGQQRTARYVLPPS